MTCETLAAIDSCPTLHYIKCWWRKMFICWNIDYYLLEIGFFSMPMMLNIKHVNWAETRSLLRVQLLFHVNNPCKICGTVRSFFCFFFNVYSSAICNCWIQRFIFKWAWCCIELLHLVIASLRPLSSLIIFIGLNCKPTPSEFKLKKPNTRKSEQKYLWFPTLNNMNFWICPKITLTKVHKNPIHSSHYFEYPRVWLFFHHFVMYFRTLIKLD